MLPGNGKFERTGLGSDREVKEATNTAFNFLKANAGHISGMISTTTKDYIVNYQDLQGIGMTARLALPTLIALASIALNKPTVSSLAVMGEISIAGTMMKVDELANALQVCLDSGAKKVLLPITSAADLGSVPSRSDWLLQFDFLSECRGCCIQSTGSRISKVMKEWMTLGWDAYDQVPSSIMGPKQIMNVIHAADVAA